MTVEPAYQLRDAEARDLPFAERLYLATMEPLLTALGDWDRERFRQRIRRLFKAEESRIILVDGRPAGWIQLVRTAREVNIAQLHLEEAHRGRGIGTSLIAAVIREALADGKAVTLSAPRNNPAIALYRRMGFVVVRDDQGSIIDMQLATETRPAVSPPDERESAG